MSGFLIYCVLNSFSSAFFSFSMLSNRNFWIYFHNSSVNHFMHLICSKLKSLRTDWTFSFPWADSLFSSISKTDFNTFIFWGWGWRLILVSFYCFSMGLPLPAYLIRYSAECLFGLDRYTTQVYWLCYM